MKPQAILTIAAALTIPTLSIASEGFIKSHNKQRVESWIEEKMNHIINNQFTNTSHDDYSNATRTITQTKYDQKSKATGQYNMHGTFRNKRTHANAIIEFSTEYIHYTDTNNYEGSIKWNRLYINGYSGTTNLKDEYDSGFVGFLPAGRIEIDGEVYQPK